MKKALFAVVGGGDCERLFVYHPDWPYRVRPERTASLGFELAGADGVYRPAEIVNLRKTVTSFDRLTRRESSEYRGEIEGRRLVLRARA